MAPSLLVALEAVPKAAFYAAVALALGTVTARWLLSRADAGPRAGAASALLGNLARAAGLLAIVAVTARLFGHTVAVFDGADALVLENLRTVGVASRWGSAWRLQGIAAVVMAASSVPLRGDSAWRWRVFTMAALACCAAVPLVGHAAGSPARYALHLSHVAASGAWLGTLASITMLHRRATRAPADAAAMPDVAGLVHRFSPLALAAAAVVLSSGALAAVLYVGGFAPLVSTDYGRLLLVKLACVAAVLACGGLNWRRSRRGEAPSRVLLALECALAVLTLVVTGVLTETEHP